MNDNNIFSFRLKSKGRVAQRDIVQFVPYRKFKNVSYKQETMIVHCLLLLMIEIMVVLINKTKETNYQHMYCE